MLIASKYEEIYAPEVRDFVYITDRAYTKEEILDQEYDMLTQLEFNITAPTSWRFLERFCKMYEADGLLENLSRYLVELSMIEYRMLKHCPSMLASAAMYLTMKILKRKTAWPESMQEITQYKETQVRTCAKDLCILLQGVDRCSFQAVRKKFSLTKYNEVAKIKLENK